MQISFSKVALEYDNIDFLGIQRLFGIFIFTISMVLNDNVAA